MPETETGTGEGDAPSTRALIDALASEGEHVDAGQFSLDPERALAKLRDYQLADPHTYLALVLEAAYLGSEGEARVMIETGASETSVAFTGLPLTEHSVHNLLSAVFRDAPEDPAARLEARTTQLLALALNGALGLEPRRVRVEVAGPNGAVSAIELSADHTVTTASEVRDAPPGRTRFVVELAGFGLRRSSHVETLVRERCRHSTLTVYLDQELVSLGPRAALSAREVGPSPELPVMLDGEQIGVAGFARALGRDRALIYTRGVLADTLWLDGDEGFVAVVEVDLAKDLSQARVIRDAAFEAVEAAILAAHARASPPTFVVEGGVRISGHARGRSGCTSPVITLFGILLMLALVIAFANRKGAHEAPRATPPAGPHAGTNSPPAARWAPPPNSTAIYELLEGVSELATGGVEPAPMQVYAPAFSVARAGHEQRTIVAASRWVGGRVVATTTGTLGADALAQADNATFVTNAAAWLGGRPPAELDLVCVGVPAACELLAGAGAKTQVRDGEQWWRELGDRQVLITTTLMLASPEIAIEVEYFVTRGGGLLIANHQPEGTVHQPADELLGTVGIDLGRAPGGQAPPSLAIRPSQTPRSP